LEVNNLLNRATGPVSSASDYLFVHMAGNANLASVVVE